MAEWVKYVFNHIFWIHSCPKGFEHMAADVYQQGQNDQN